MTLTTDSAMDRAMRIKGELHRRAEDAYPGSQYFYDHESDGWPSTDQAINVYEHREDARCKHGFRLVLIDTLYPEPV